MPQRSPGYRQFIECVRSGKTIEIYGDGGHKREWLHPEDVGTAIAAAISWVARAEDTGWETFLVSSGTGVSMADLAKKVIATTGQGEVEFQPSTRQAAEVKPCAETWMFEKSTPTLFSPSHAIR